MSQERKKLFLMIAVAIAMTLWSLFSFSYLIFGILGKTSEDKAWSYVLVLYVCLAVAASGVTWQKFGKQRVIGSYLTATATGAILGFFSVGWVTNESPLWASVGAIIVGLGSLISCHQAQRKLKIWHYLVLLAINTGSTVAVYGFALLVGTNAIALLTGGHLLAGICWMLVSVYSLWLTITNPSC
ncbi:hypothetical protein [Merismopedia glauca]|uniref:Uncharacterized protein n=1 Tax=Merismopedia glauca CCAP 1448/3 TaxID=1296344 RepID=A0A2T1C2P6_9CYAN|nr:hypothetical protein [Merismopedia glauca]PSB02474.1 hypothetical protein C7B64_13085 [Merismopedia glauca CCAP 1448/3]